MNCFLKGYPLLGVFIIYVLYGCSENQSLAPEPEFSGILLTDGNGKVLGGDETDFLPRPQQGLNGEPLNIAMFPAFPNPVIGDTVILQFQLPEPDTVSFFIQDRPESAPIDTLLLNVSLPKGLLAVLWYYSGTGIFRASMKTKSGFSSFGDIEFK